jgi:hypothetical protein
MSCRGSVDVLMGRLFWQGGNVTLAALSLTSTCRPLKRPMRCFTGRPSNGRAARCEPSMMPPPSRGSNASARSLANKHRRRHAGNARISTASTRLSMIDGGSFHVMIRGGVRHRHSLCGLFKGRVSTSPSRCDLTLRRPWSTIGRDRRAGNTNYLRSGDS